MFFGTTVINLTSWNKETNYGKQGYQCTYILPYNNVVIQLHELSLLLFLMSNAEFPR